MLLDHYPDSYHTYPNVKSDLMLYGMHSAKAEQGRICERHLHQRMLEINLVLSGSQTTVVGATSYNLGPGDLILIPPMQLHDFHVNHSEGTQYFVIHLQNASRELMQHMLKSGQFFYPRSHPLNDQLRPLVLTLFEQLQKGASTNRIIFICSDILVRLEDHYESLALAAPPLLERSLASTIAHEIELLFSTTADPSNENRFTSWLETIAQKLKISRRHCNRMFQKEYGMSPREYLTIIRQQEAMHKLVGSNETLERIARHIGFENAQSFIRQFTKWTGMTPGAFRKSNRQTFHYLTPLEVEQNKQDQ